MKKNALTNTLSCYIALVNHKGNYFYNLFPYTTRILFRILPDKVVPESNLLYTGNK